MLFRITCLLIFFPTTNWLVNYARAMKAHRIGKAHFFLDSLSQSKESLMSTLFEDISTNVDLFEMRRYSFLFFRGVEFLNALHEQVKN